MATRNVVAGVDWPCTVQTNFAESNMGCGKRVASGISWALQHVAEAVILEDDCLPDPTFFRFSGDLLAYYRDDARVMMISGNNFQNGVTRTDNSYYFSRFPHCWGWATWRRAWNHFDFTISGWPEKRTNGWLKSFTADREIERLWQACFDGVAAGTIDAWDYQWAYSIWSRGGLSIVPDANLVTNIGFGADATHTHRLERRYSVPSRPMAFPLRHPSDVNACDLADSFEQRYLNRVGFLRSSSRAHPSQRGVGGRGLSSSDRRPKSIAHPP